MQRIAAAQRLSAQIEANIVTRQGILPEGRLVGETSKLLQAKNELQKGSNRCVESDSKGTIQKKGRRPINVLLKLGLVVCRLCLEGPEVKRWMRRRMLEEKESKQTEGDETGDL